VTPSLISGFGWRGGGGLNGLGGIHVKRLFFKNINLTEKSRESRRKKTKERDELKCTNQGWGVGGGGGGGGGAHGGGRGGVGGERGGGGGGGGALRPAFTPSPQPRGSADDM